MRVHMMLLTGLAAYFAPEILPWDASVKQIEWLLKEITYDSILAWMIVLGRRFVFVSLPRYLMLWFLRPLAPRWVRRRIDRLAVAARQLAAKVMHEASQRFALLTVTPFRIFLSLTLAVGIFWAFYHWFGHYVVVIIGFWPFVKPYMLYGVNSIQHTVFRAVTFLGVQKLFPPVLKRIPRQVYEWVYTRIHLLYMLALKLQIRLRRGCWRATCYVFSPASETRKDEPQYKL